MLWGLFIGSLAATTQAFHPAPIRWGGRLEKRFVLACKGSLDRVATPQQLTVKETFGGTLDNEIPYFTTNQDNTISCDANEKRWCLEATGTEPGHVVRVNHCTGRPAQAWKWLPWGSIQLEGTNQCVNVNESGGLNRVSVELTECANKATETWTREYTIPSTSRSSLQSPALSISSICVAVMLAALSLGAWVRRWQKQSRGVVAAGHGCRTFTMDQAGVCLTVPTSVQSAEFPLVANQCRRGDIDVRCGPRRFDTNEIVMQLESAKDQPTKKKKKVQPTKEEEGQALVVVLDLDECLVHALSRLYHMTNPPVGYDEMQVKNKWINDGKLTVLKRKSLDVFLKTCLAKYETYIFTAGDPWFIDPVIDKLEDSTGCKFAGRFYSRDNTELANTSAKDLGIVAKKCGRRGALDRIVLVDNSIDNFALQPRNGILVPSFEPPVFRDDASHDVLMGLLDTLNDLHDSQLDVRDRLHQLYQIGSNARLFAIRSENCLIEDHTAFNVALAFTLKGPFTTWGMTSSGKPRYRNAASDVVAWEQGQLIQVKQLRGTISRWTIRNKEGELQFWNEQDSKIPPEKDWKTGANVPSSLLVQHRAADASTDLKGEVVTVSEIRVISGAHIDQITFVYSDGSSRKWGCEESVEGVEQDAFVLQRGEYITKVIQEVNTAMDMVQFFTSTGRKSPNYGNPEAPRRGAGRPGFEFVASKGMQIIKLQRFYGPLQGISNVTEAPAPSAVKAVW